MEEHNMGNFDHRQFLELQDRIIVHLAGLYYEMANSDPLDGRYQDYEAYANETNGGFYEHKLAANMGFDASSGSPPNFKEACRSLMENGYVRRTVRNPEFKELGIWPTKNGLARAAYLSLPFHRRLLIQIRNKLPEILTSIITTVITLVITWFFGLFDMS